MTAKVATDADKDRRETSQQPYLANEREQVFLNSAFFVLGFTLVFSVVGVLLQTALSQASLEAVFTIRLVGGSVIVAFGALMIASAKYAIPFFSVEHKIHVRKFRNSYITSSVFGISFALGWTPCVGAILGSVYTLAAVSPGLGFIYLLAFSLGLGIPFLLAGAFISRVAGFLRKTGRFLRYFSIVSGLFLMAVGLLVVTNYIGVLQIFLNGVGPLGSLANPFGQFQLNFLIALSAGFLTFISPCILPLVPAFLAYVSGTSVEAVKR
ncbi:MAG TPA: cytochrome c biogenesis protein CcdA [Nitrososphaerales archaeon]|nr:cytochrome c biogenesis protein CcdA [Nitrososphaerales archaeon]